MKTIGACAMLLAFPDRRSRQVEPALYAFLVMFALVIPPAAETCATYVIGYCTANVWANAAYTSAYLIREARATRIPSITRVVLLALLPTFIATVLVPAILLGLRGGDFMAVAGLLACTAAAGALLQDLPGATRGILLLLVYVGVFMPMVISIDMRNSNFTVLAWTAAAVLVGLAYLRWVWGLRDKSESAMSAEADPRRGLRSISDRRDRNSKSVLAGWLSSLRYHATAARVGPQHSASAMRGLLGQPFAPQSRLRRCISWASLIAGLVLCAWFMSWVDGKPKTFVTWLVLVGSFSIWGSFGGGLKVLFSNRGGESKFWPQRQHHAEFYELALIPGWGDARNARRILLWSVLQPQLFALLSLWLAATLLVFAWDGKAIAYLIILCAVTGIAMAYVAYTLRALASLSWSLPGVLCFAAISFAAVFTQGTFRYVFGYEAHPDRPLEAIIAWLVVYVLMGLLAKQAYRCFIARPHPFLTN
ncbi:MAG TPA: hypothetical protein VK660_08655 [Xanthomonadaceae bacterium]|nr:hypothetical protein [Xanthomonadaceae bacterium]